MHTFLWYESINSGDPLQQGDIICGCPIYIPQESAKDSVVVNSSEQRGNPAAETKDSLTAIEETYDVIVLTQSCDLAAAKVKLATVCPVWTLEKLVEDEPKFTSRSEKERLRQGKYVNLHLLNACSLLDGQFLVVDFRLVLGVQLGTLSNIAQSAGNRPRLLPPYREHMSQAFARFFMRVGLPSDIPSF